MSDQHQTLLQVDAVSDETPAGLCQQVGASEEAMPSQITNWGCWNRRVDAASKRGTRLLVLSEAELRTQEETLPDAFDDAQGNAVVTSAQGT